MAIFSFRRRRIRKKRCHHTKPSPLLVAPEDINNIVFWITSATAKTLNLNLFLLKLFVYSFCCLFCTVRGLIIAFKEVGWSKSGDIEVRYFLNGTLIKFLMQNMVCLIERYLNVAVNILKETGQFKMTTILT